MDQNNPNRDLSDPTWISVGAYHHEQKKRMDDFKRKQSENRKPTFPKKIKAFYNDGNEDFEYIEIFSETIKCETCQKQGAYYIEDDSECIGLCLNHLKEQYDKVEEIN
jgi:Zn/Cd-binding protein ZinT